MYLHTYGNPYYIVILKYMAKLRINTEIFVKLYNVEVELLKRLNNNEFEKLNIEK